MFFNLFLLIYFLLLILIQSSAEHLNIFIIVSKNSINWGSTILRGYLLADEIQKFKHKVKVITDEDLLALDYKFDVPNTNEICVCLKSCTKAVTNKCYSIHRKVVWDILDYPISGYITDLANNNTYANILNRVNCTMANSHRHKQILIRKYGAKKVTVVYHQHMNVFGYDRNISQSSWPPREGYRTLCFVGSRDNQLSKQVLNDITKKLQQFHMKLNVIISTPKHKLAYLNHSVQSLWKTQQQHLLQLVSDCDIAFVMPNSRDSFTLSYRPVTRLVTWWSLGIPTMYYPLAQYQEISSNSITKKIQINNVKDLINKLKWLLNPRNREEVVELVKMQKMLSFNFNMNNIAKSYLAAIQMCLHMG